VNTALFEAEKYDRKGYSQFGETGILLELVRRLNPPKRFVEIGCGDGSENNTRDLLEMGWRGVWYDADRENVGKAWVINALTFLQRVQPDTIIPVINAPIGVLSIDVDGNDYWLWKGLGPKLDPSIVIIECQIQREGEYIMAYDPDYVWSHKDNDCGASLQSMIALGQEMGYTFVGMPANPHSPNAFFVKNELVPRLEVR